MNNKLLAEKAFVEISTYRTKVFESIGQGPKIPTAIAKDTGLRVNHISNTLRELKERELVKCINEECRKGRVYKLTHKGEGLMHYL